MRHVTRTNGTGKEIKVRIIESFQKRLDHPVEMNPPSRRYYGLLRFFLKFYGLHPDLKPRQKLIRSIFVSFNIWTLILLQMLNLVTVEYKTETFLETLTYSLPCLSVAVSYYTCYFKQKQTWNLFCEIDRYYEETEDIEEIKIMRKYTDEWRLYVQMLIVAFYIFYMMPYNIPVLSIILDIVLSRNKERSRRLPVSIECFIDRDKYFYEIFFFAYFLGMENGTVAVVILAATLMIVQHARGLFHVVGYVLEQVFDHGPSSSCKNRDTKIYESVVRVIKSHRRAISFVEKVNSIMEIGFLMNMALAILLIGISFVKIFCIGDISNYTDETITAISYVTGNFVFLYINCYVGQRLLDQSGAVFEQICQTPWYLASTRTQKLSLLMLQKSIKPSCISVGKIFVASHELFSSILQTSLSYATVYYSVQ